MELQKIFGSNVRQYRRAIHWTLEQLATEVGVSRETIGKIERGISAPLFDTVEKIASALGVSPLVLFDASPHPAGKRGELLADINLSLANLNERELSSVKKLIAAIRDR